VQVEGINPSYLYKAEVRDVIDADTFPKGRYLNQEFVDKGFANVV